MKIKLLLSFLFLFLVTFNSFSQEKELKKKTFIMQNTSCKGKIVLDYTTSTIHVEVGGKKKKCEYHDYYNGPFEVLENGAVRVVFDEKAAWKYMKDEVIIEDRCFIWGVRYRFCEE